MAILIVDPCTESRQAAIDVIKWADGRRTVAVAESAATAWSVALEERPDLVFCEPVLPDMNGEALCSKLREKLPSSLFVAYTRDPRLQIEYCPYDGILQKPASKLSILPHLHAARVRRKTQPAPINPPDQSTSERSHAWRKSNEEIKPCKILVSMAEENELKFSLPVPRQATVDAVLRQLGKQSVLSYTLFRNRAAIPTELSTCVSDGDELCIKVAATA